MTSYEYDVFGNLRSVTLPNSDVVTYEVDGLNRRTVRKLNGTRTARYLYEDRLRISAELDSGNQIRKRFIYGDSPNVPDYMEYNGERYIFVKDIRGSVVGVVNSQTGEVKQAIEYDDWGRIIRDTNPGFQPFGFAGGLYDHETKLVRFGARDYDSETGRWTSKDPILFAGGDTNLYGYVLQDPLSFVDPEGLIVIDVMRPDILGGGGAPGGAGGEVLLIPPLIIPQLVDPTNTLNENIRDTGLQDISNDKIQRRARDRSLNPQERRRYQKEEKVRGLRNKQERGNKCP